MSYPLLSSLYYQNNEEYEKEYTNRFNSIGAIRIPLKVNDSEAFIVITPEMMTRLQQIYNYNVMITDIFNKFPGIAKESIVNEYLIEEIINTNGIEGVHSTRKEIKIALQKNNSPEKNDEKMKRFEGLTKKYVNILNNKSIKINNCNDIITLYNELVKPEIENNDYPDGKFFRKEMVDVLSETQKTIHVGVYPESKIIEYMEALINFINFSDVPTIVKSAIVQYFIGYIHPFYDGNGRLGRYIGSEIISHGLSKLVSIRLSYTIKENISKYYNAFKICNNPINKGDLTPFVIFVFDMVYQSSKGTCQHLMEKDNQLKFFLQKVKSIQFDSKHNELYKQILGIFIQNALFSSEKLDYQVLAAFTNKSYNTVKDTVDEMIELGIPVIMEKGKKIMFAIDLDKFKDI